MGFTIHAALWPAFFTKPCVLIGRESSPWVSVLLPVFLGMSKCEVISQDVFVASSPEEIFLLDEGQVWLLFAIKWWVQLNGS